MTNKTERDSNLELLRIVAMIFIVLHHFVVHGYQLAKLNGKFYSVFPVTNFAHSYELLISNSFFIVGVNLFILISGYYSIRLKWKSFLNLFIICLFYDYLQLLVSDIYTFHHLKMHWEPFTEIFTRSGWFIICYMALMLLSPGINIAVEKFTDKQKLYGLAVLLVLNFWFGYYLDTKLVNQSGYSLMQFVFIYYIGRMLKVYEQRLRCKTIVFFGGYIIFTLILSWLAITQFKEKSYVSMWQLYHYNNPLIVLSAVFLFLTFKNFSIKSSAINWFSSSILAVYLIHESPFVSKHLYSFIFETIRKYGHFGYKTILILTGIFIAIMFGSVLMDKMRMLLTNPVVSYSSMKMEKLQLFIENKISDKWTSTSK
jgi:hypothetical protein